jgi:hypothetical protein
MNLDAVGNIAELISAIGVVATLADLAVQIRQSSITSRANIRQQLAGQQIAYVTFGAAEPLLRSASLKLRARESLTAEESLALQAYAVAGLRLFESCHAQWEYGTLPDEDWDAVQRRYETLLASEAFAREFSRNPDYFNPRFAALVRSIIGNTGA